MYLQAFLGMKKGRKVKVREGDVATEAEAGLMQDHNPRNTGSLWKLEKASK